MDSARLHGPLKTPATLFSHPDAAGPKVGKELTILRTDRQQYEAAKGPAVSAVITPTARALAAQDSRPLAPRPGKDEPKIETAKPAAPTAKTPAKGPAKPAAKPAEPTSHIPDHLGPMDVATSIQPFGGLNVRSSVGGPKLTSGN